MEKEQKVTVWRNKKYGLLGDTESTSLLPDDEDISIKSK